MKNKYRNLFFSMLLVLFIWFFQGCYHQRTVVSPELYVRYHYSSEGVFQNIVIRNTRLTYTYFPEEVARKRFSRWVKQEPCWKKSDLLTRNAILDKSEKRELVSTIIASGFMTLDKIYGSTSATRRYYPYRLSVRLGNRENVVEYRSFPESAPMPTEFKTVRDKLYEIVKSKFK